MDSGPGLRGRPSIDARTDAVYNNDNNDDDFNHF